MVHSILQLGIDLFERCIFGPQSLELGAAAAATALFRHHLGSNLSQLPQKFLLDGLHGLLVGLVLGTRFQGLNSLFELLLCDVNDEQSDISFRHTFRTMEMSTLSPVCNERSVSLSVRMKNKSYRHVAVVVVLLNWVFQAASLRSREMMSK